MKQYDIVLIDPPISYYGQQDKWGAAAKFYPLMTDDELRTMDIMSLTNETSIVFLWATCPRLDFAIDLMRDWGFHYRGVAFVWVKSTKDGRPIGARGVRPSIVKPTTELVLAGSRIPKGRPMPVADESIPQVVLHPVQEHSRKPETISERIELLYPNATRLEMFARRQRNGWDVWGNETDKWK